MLTQGGQLSVYLTVAAIFLKHKDRSPNFWAQPFHVRNDILDPISWIPL